MVSPADPKTEFFPGANPHPVMRVATDGELIYANAASQPVIDALGLVVGQAVPAAWLETLLTSDGPIDVRVGARTFELLAVPLPDLGFANVYGTDVTAQRAITKFPDQNPNPVFRISLDGILVYVNAAAHELIDGLGGTLGEPFPQPWAGELRAAALEGQRRSVHVHSAGRHFELLPVDVPEFQFMNVYGTDVTAQRQLEAANQQNLELLLNILPEPIADRIRAGEGLIADRHEDVSLLFADIVGFTAMSSAMDPEELVRLLDEVFGVFDALVDASELEKVKTIGDAYMIVGGMPIWHPDHLERMADLAIDIAQAVNHHDAAARLGVSFRIGIHTGSVVAGVVGKRRSIYDVWGDTVNLASRMESTGVAGRIQVSGSVEERLRGGYRLESRGVVDIKGKGPMETFFLIDRA
jgi:class 3 adenylate cyclase